jgi:hypothetical protein
MSFCLIISTLKIISTILKPVIIKQILFVFKHLPFVQAMKGIKRSDVVSKFKV